MADEPLLSDDLTPLLTRMSGVLLSLETLETALGLVTSLAAQTLPTTAGAGVTLVDAAGKRTRASTDPEVERADALQYELDEGPCLTAWREQRIVRMDDVSTDPRWPRWSRAVGGLGVRSVLSAPMTAADDSIGALKVYSPSPRAYDEPAEQVLELFARQAAILLANVVTLEQAQQRSAQLKEALRNRDLIGQAKGVLIAQGAPGEDAAFELLVTASQRSSTKLFEVARQLVASATTRATTRPS